MAIRKQEFYEGAALHQLVRSGKVDSVRYQMPFFALNGTALVLLKYSTKGRSPWSFTFTTLEQILLSEKATTSRLHVGLVCGSDGVAAINYETFLKLVPSVGVPTRVACFRDHGEHYQINGPAGALDRKVSPSNWMRILDTKEGGLA